MSTYATPDELADRFERLGLATPDDPERLLADAEQDVDLVVGGVRDPDTGRVFPDLTLLSAAQVGALREATLRACEFRARLDGDDLSGTDSFLPAEMSIVRRGGRPPGPAVEEALVGHALILRSGCAPPSPDEPPMAA